MTYLIITLVGLAFGSFGNVILYRMPRGESVRGRSRCRKCGTTLNWSDLIPLASFVLLLGKCRHCKSAISIRYPLFEAVVAAVFLLVFIAHETGAYFSLMALLAACYVLLLIAFYDAATKKIPDIFSATLILLAMVFQLTHGSENIPWKSIIGGAAVPLVFFGGLWLISHGKWIGSGDILLGTGIGLLLGLKLTLFALFFAYAAGAAAAAYLMVTGRAKRGSTIAFGPFLCAGAIGVLLAGKMIL